MTLEYAGEPLSRYDIEYLPGSTELKAVSRPELFETSRVLPQLRLFRLDILGEGGWLKAMKLEEYAPCKLQRPVALQQALFAYTEAL